MGVPFDLKKYVQHRFDQVELTIDDFRPCQPIAVQFLLDHKFSALFIDVGLGKTSISLTAILHLLTNFQMNHCLVVAPKRVALETWPSEILKWQHTAPITFAHVRDEELIDAVNKAGIAERKKLKEEARLEAAMWKLTNPAEIKEEIDFCLSLRSAKVRIARARAEAARIAVREQFQRNPAVVHIVNKEQLEFLADAWGRDWPYDCVFVDESSCLKDHTTGRFKALKAVRPFIKRLHQLTATPAAETYMHLFAQIYLLDQGARLGNNITYYRERYFTHNKYTREWKLRPGAEEEIVAKIADICLVMKAEDWLDLLDPLVVPEKVRMNAEQMALYRQMERESVVALPTGEVEAETAAALSQKLLQMASGVLYESVPYDAGRGTTKFKRVVHELHEHKLDALEQLVDSLEGECVLVAYWHESSLARLKKRFGYAKVMDSDGKCIKDWNKRKIKMLLVHPQSSGHGLNIQFGGKRIIFYDTPWSLELYQQLIGRLAGARQLSRPEHERLVMVHHLITEGTIDEEVVEALVEKRSMQELFFKLLKRFRARHAASSGLKLAA